MNFLKNLIISLAPLIIFTIFTIIYLNRDPFPTPLPSIESTFQPSPSKIKNLPPRLAYFISGLKYDGEILKRILQAIYHPHNLYLVHLDADADPIERKDLYSYIASNAIFSEVGNVKVISKPNSISVGGPTSIANTLHAAAILLKEGGDWDWFINLSAYSYPLVTQDDLLYVLSEMPRHLNFIDHHVGFGDEMSKESIVDPSLHLLGRQSIVHISDTVKEEIPNAFKLPTAFTLFTGTPWMALTHSFIEYCILGWDNLPRTIFLYHTNTINSAESYFQTVICNSEEFHNTTVNTDLHSTEFENTQRTNFLLLNNMRPLLDSGAPFARKVASFFPGVLNWIDEKLLSRGNEMLVPGDWCAGLKHGQIHNVSSGEDPCLEVGDVTKLRPGRGYKRLKSFFHKILRQSSLETSQCQVASTTDEMKTEGSTATSNVVGHL